jgi:hypothetical protein
LLVNFSFREALGRFKGARPQDRAHAISALGTEWARFRASCKCDNRAVHKKKRLQSARRAVRGML